MSAANTFTTTTLSMPIPRVTGGARTATIMELLYVDLVPHNIDLANAGDHFSFSLSIGAAPTAQQEINQSTTVAYKQIDTEAAATVEKPLRIQLQDQNGFGFLVASDTLNVNGDSAGQAMAVVFNFRIYYRFVTVPIAEYVGIVSSLM